MSKLLLGYIVNGQTIGKDIFGWEGDLGGNPAFKIIVSGDTMPTGYADISTIETWNRFGCQVANDYLVCKNEIRNLVISIGWSGLTTEEKDLAIHYYAYNTDVEAVIYLMTEKGMSQLEAQMFLLQQWHKHHHGVISTCVQRWYYVKYTVPMFLSFNDCEDLFSDPVVLSLITQMGEVGLIGTAAGDNRDGIVNFVDSTGIFTGNGLREKGYTLDYGTYDELIYSIKIVMLEGIYEKYDDI